MATETNGHRKNAHHQNKRIDDTVIRHPIAHNRQTIYVKQLKDRSSY